MASLCAREGRHWQAAKASPADRSGPGRRRPEGLPRCARVCARGSSRHDAGLSGISTCSTLELAAAQARERGVGFGQRETVIVVLTGTRGRSRGFLAVPARQVGDRNDAPFAPQDVVGKAGMSDMWMPAQTTVPPLQYDAQRSRDQRTDGAKISAASMACGGAWSASPASPHRAGARSPGSRGRRCG